MRITFEINPPFKELLTSCAQYNLDHVRNGKNGDYSNNKVDSRSSQVLEEIRHAEAVQTLQRAKIEAVRIINFLQKY